MLPTKFYDFGIVAQAEYGYGGRGRGREGRGWGTRGKGEEGERGVRGRGRTFKFLCFYSKALESSLHTQS